MKTVTVVVSVYNEEQALPEFYQAVKKVLDKISWDHELLFVNDGSRDGSLSVLERLAGQDERVKIVSFSRNFGHIVKFTVNTDNIQIGRASCRERV